MYANFLTVLYIVCKPSAVQYFMNFVVRAVMQEVKCNMSERKQGCPCSPIGWVHHAATELFTLRKVEILMFIFSQMTSTLSNFTLPNVPEPNGP